MEAIDEISSNILNHFNISNDHPISGNKTIEDKYKNLKSFEKLLLIEMTEPPKQETNENLLPTYYTPTTKVEESLPKKKNILSSNTSNLLEDYTPFNTKFYKLLYSLVCVGYSQEFNFEIPQEFDYEYSLYDIVQVRVTRILYCIILHFDKYNFEWDLFISEKQTQTIPSLYILLLKYISNLSKIESFIHVLDRKSRYIQTSNIQKRMEILQSSDIFSSKTKNEFTTHQEHLEYILGQIYNVSNCNLRKWLRSKIGSRLYNFSITSTSSTISKYEENTIASGINIYLYVLLRILPQVASKKSVHQQLLFEILLPLHKTNQIILWRDQIPILSLYHESLVLNIIQILKLYPSFTAKTINEICSAWPRDQGNTSKIVLLLHEIDCIISSVVVDELIDLETLENILKKLNVCIQGDNSRTAEQALQFWKNPKFESLLKSYTKDVMKMLLRMICRVDVHMEKSWNPTVNKMLFLVLEKIEGYDDECLFRAEVESIFNSSTIPNIDKEEETKKTKALPPASSTVTPNMISLKGAMGTWKPPTKKSNKPSKQPPLTVTGVAPWAMNNTMQPPPNKKIHQQPPVTITGVAPWAISNTSRIKKQEQIINKQTEEVPNESKAYQKYLNYKNSLCPQTSTQKQDWSKLQLAETPTLLPNLKFHDLVFGHVLGTGAFSTVKYAKRIQRDSTRSSWQEFAIKIVNINTITQLGYKTSISREISILRSLSHPNIARLISSFYFQDGVYLVLEYASKGDLYTALTKMKLTSVQIQFCSGEILAALLSIHENGYVFGDLKPENVLITASDHVKLTDFGGCRPYNKHENYLNVLRNLRDGGWRENTKGLVNGDDMEEEEDDRIEGTTAYLPPEVVMGERPSPFADTWAFACVLYQCITGKPPLLSDNDEYTREKIVSFDVSNATEDIFNHSSFQQQDELTKNAQELIKQCLQYNIKERLSCNAIQQHAYFKNINIFTLYKQDAHPFNFDSSREESQWSRRQFSSIWSPQPSKYTLSKGGNNSSGNSMANYIDKSIFRKDLIVEREEECDYYFLNHDGNVAASSGLPLTSSIVSNDAKEIAIASATAMEIIGEEDDESS